jgi:U3 small nucleolar RNA-associated protein 10
MMICFLGFVSDAITFIHECAEDENDDVAREARKLKRVMEMGVGNAL